MRGDEYPSEGLVDSHELVRPRQHLEGPWP